MFDPKPISDDTTDRPLLADKRLSGAFKGSHDWAGVFVDQTEVWIGHKPDGLPEVLPEEFARVFLTHQDRAGNGARPAIHLEFARNPELAGLGGDLVVTFASAEEAFHLAVLLARAGAEAVRMGAERRPYPPGFEHS